MHWVDLLAQTKTKRFKAVLPFSFFLASSNDVFIDQIFSQTCSRPYSAAKSRGLSCRLFLMVGSVSSCSSTETTSECPYWAAQWSAVSFSWFCGRTRKKWILKRVKLREGGGVVNLGIIGIIKSQRHEVKWATETWRDPGKWWERWWNFEGDKVRKMECKFDCNIRYKKVVIYK